MLVGWIEHVKHMRVLYSLVELACQEHSPLKPKLWSTGCQYHRTFCLWNQVVGSISRHCPYSAQTPVLSIYSRRSGRMANRKKKTVVKCRDHRKNCPKKTTEVRIIKIERGFSSVFIANKVCYDRDKYVTTPGPRK